MAPVEKAPEPGPAPSPVAHFPRSVSSMIGGALATRTGGPPAEAKANERYDKQISMQVLPLPLWPGNGAVGLSAINSTKSASPVAGL